jgi:hypothetical protein
MVAALSLALAIDRRGAPEDATALVTERVHADPRALLASPGPGDLLAVAAAERWALVAEGLEATSPGEARRLWQRYLLEAPSSPWAPEARRRAGTNGTAALGGRP